MLGLALRRARPKDTLVLLLAFALLDGILGIPGSSVPGQEPDFIAARRNLMPAPRHVEFMRGSLVIRRDFSAGIDVRPGGIEPRVERAVIRMLERLARQTRIPIRPRLAGDAANADLLIAYRQAVR